MLDACFIHFLRRLRSQPVRGVLAEIFKRLCSAALVGAGWFAYVGGPDARAAICALSIAGVALFIAALAATTGGEP